MSLQMLKEHVFYPDNLKRHDYLFEACRDLSEITVEIELSDERKAVILKTILDQLHIFYNVSTLDFFDPGVAFRCQLKSLIEGSKETNVKLKIKELQMLISLAHKYYNYDRPDPKVGEIEVYLKQSLIFEIGRVIGAYLRLMQLDGPNSRAELNAGIAFEIEFDPDRLKENKK